MRIISLWLLVFTITVCAARGQDTATQQQIDKLSGQIQDLLATQERQGKQLDELRKQITELSDKVNSPVVNVSASREDLKTLAAQVQEIDKKRQSDRDLILKEISKLGSVGAATGHKAQPTASATDDPAPVGPQKGYEHVVQSGETISAIAKAYRDQGVKVTTPQILKANPKLDASKLFVGQKVFIPDPNAK
jgi:LysM repeat protein